MPAYGQPLVLVAAAAGDFRLEELGQDVRTEGDGLIVVSTPPRFGLAIGKLASQREVTVHRLRPDAALGEIEVRLDCTPGASDDAGRHWLSRVPDVEAEWASFVSSARYPEARSHLQPVLDTAPAGYFAALAQHLDAQSLTMSGRSAEAVAAWQVAEKAWLSLGDRPRALAARVARSEEVQRLSRSDEVLVLTREFPGTPDRTSQFGVRLEGSRCVALQFLGRLEESAVCYAWVTAALKALGEDLELTSMRLDFAQLERDRGHLDQALAIATLASTTIFDLRWDHFAGPDVPIVRGRVQRLFADIAVRNGNLAEGLRRSELAMREFQRAGNERWQANTLLRVAALYRELGAVKDADDAVAAALTHLSPTDAPARVAVAQIERAEILLADGQSREAAAIASEASSALEHLKVSADRARADLVRAEAALARGDLDAATEIAALPTSNVPTTRFRLELLSAEVEAARHPGATSAVPDAAPAADRPFSEWLRWQKVLSLRESDPMAALRRLEQARVQVDALRAKTSSTSLRLILSQQRQRLRQFALPVIARVESPQRQAELAWHWWITTEFEPQASAPTSGPTSDRVAFDRALAESLLPTAQLAGDKPRVTDAEMQRQLLGVIGRQLGRPPTSQRVSAPPDLRSVQAALAPSDALAVTLLAAERSAILWIRRDEATLRFVPVSSQPVRDRQSALATAVDGFAPVATIARQAQELSVLLLSGAPGAAPARLLLAGDRASRRIPWPLLRWPGSDHELVLDTAISHIGAADDDPTPETTLTLFAFALDAARPTAGLPVLSASIGEQKRVAERARTLQWSVAAAKRATRAAVLEALATPSAWVHVASHGGSDADRLARSGIWLEPDDGGVTPELLSWLDVVEHGVKARTVFLNACDLAQHPGRSTAGSNFAEAVLRSGAHDVVAASWSVSDTAAALLSDEFYRTLPRDADSAAIAEALRQAMQRLHDHRFYRHPRYWAGMVHYTRMPLATPRHPDPVSSLR